MRIKETISADEVGKFEDVLPELKRMIGKYARWRCDKCGIEKEHQISIFTRPNGDLMPTCGWACQKCGMRGQMVFQELIKEEEQKIKEFKEAEKEVVERITEPERFLE